MVELVKTAFRGDIDQHEAITILYTAITESEDEQSIKMCSIYPSNDLADVE